VPIVLARLLRAELPQAAGVVGVVSSHAAQQVGEDSVCLLALGGIDCLVHQPTEPLLLVGQHGQPLAGRRRSQRWEVWSAATLGQLLGEIAQVLHLADGVAQQLLSARRAPGIKVGLERAQDEQVLAVHGVRQRVVRLPAGSVLEPGTPRDEAIERRRLHTQSAG
jgi:hypothetical protein